MLTLLVNEQGQVTLHLGPTRIVCRGKVEYLGKRRDIYGCPAMIDGRPFDGNRRVSIQTEYWFRDSCHVFQALQITEETRDGQVLSAERFLSKVRDPVKTPPPLTTGLPLSAAVSDGAFNIVRGAGVQAALAQAQ